MKFFFCFLFFLTGLTSAIQAQTLSIDDIVFPEGNDRLGRSATFTVTRSGDLQKSSTVKYQTANGTAFSGKDYEAKSGTLVFDPGVDKQSIEVRVFGDPIDENDETFFVNLSTPMSATITKAKGQATIQDDDAPPTISIEDVILNEGNASTIANFKVILSEESSKSITVKYRTADDTAIAPGDYTAKTGTLTFAAGTKSMVIPVTLVGDVYAEPDENFKVNLSDPVNATILDGQATGTLLNDDTGMTFITINDPTVKEGNSGETQLVFTVSITAPIKQTCSVDYKTADGTAKVATNDYQATSGTVVFAPNNGDPKTFTVVIHGDTAREPDETVLVNLSGPVNAKIVKAQGKGTIQNDDPRPGISISNVTVNEPNAGATVMASFVVKLSAPSHEAITVNYQTADDSATAPGDYTSASGKLTFTPGTTVATLNVTVKGDTEGENNETFFVNLSGEINATIADGQGVGLIKGNAPSEMDVEGNGNAITDGDTTPSASDGTDFGEADVNGETVVRTFTIKNTGYGSLYLNGTPKVSITGTNASDFTVTQVPNSPIAAGSNTPFQLTFNPGHTGLRKAMVTISNNDTDENPYDFAIQGTGTGTAPEMNIQGNGQDIADGDDTPESGDHTDFDNIPVSSGTVTRTFTIQNLGDADLNLTGSPKVNITGPNAADFTVTVQPSSPVLPGRSGKRGSTTFTLVFDPSGAGIRNATVSISNNDGDENPYDFAIRGNGTVNSPEVNVQGNGQDIANGDSTPTSVDHTDFGSVATSSGKITRTFTIQNLGDAALNLTGSPIVSVGGNHPSDFTVSVQPAATIAAFGSTTFQIAFDPSSSGTRTATVSIANNDGDENPYTFAIQGTGLSPAPEINVQGNGENIANGDDTPNTGDGTDFGTVVGGDSKSHTFTIQNTGDASLNLTGSPKVSVNGTHASDFTVTAQPSTPVFANCNVIFQIAFKPSATGIRSASVSISNDDGDENPYNFTIQGTATAPEINVQGNGQDIENGDDTPSESDHTDFGTSTGGAVTRTFTIQNLGNANLNLNGSPRIAISGAIDFTVTSQPSSTTIAPNENTTFQVKFDPSESGVKKATISISNNDEDKNPYTFAIKGGNPADLDTSFNETGKVTTPIGSGSDAGLSVAIQSDGKLVVAGYTHNGSNNDVAVVRYNSNGSLDTSFNGTGKVTTPIGSGDDYGYSVAIQSDGKLVVAGYTYNGSNEDLAVVRYNSNGSLDTSFNGTGKVTTPIGSGNDYGHSVAIQSDGKLVVAGYTYNGSYYDVAVVRYNSNGSLDTSFNGTGKVTTPIGSGNGYGCSVAIQSDEKIVVAGNTHNGSKGDIAVVRYTSGGSLDTSFNGTGKVTTPISSGDDQGESVAIQSDGKIVVAGTSDIGSNNDFAVVRYNSNGSLDTSFNGTGKVTTPIGSGNDYGYSVAIQSDGKIVVAGYSDNGSNNDFAVVRYNSNGSLDTSFNGTGKVTTPIGSGSVGRSVAIQSDGKIVVAGAASISGNTDFAVVRYVGDGSRSLLSATREGNRVKLTWQSPLNEYVTEYNIYRSETENGTYERINAYPIPTKTETEMEQKYTFIDSTVSKSDQYFYTLETILPDKRSKLYPPEASK